MGISKGIFEMSPDEKVSITVFFKDEQPKYFFQVSTIEINDEWLKVCYFDRFGKKILLDIQQLLLNSMRRKYEFKKSKRNTRTDKGNI